MSDPIFLMLCWIVQGDEDEPITDAGRGLAVDNGDDALLLLRALAAQDPDVKEKLKGQSEILGTRCTIM